MEFSGSLILFFSFLAMLALKIPISVAIALSSFLALLTVNSFGISAATIAQRMATGLDSFALLAIPFFILSGQLMNHGGIARRLIDFAEIFAGRFRGGLAFVNILASMFFGSISGSAVAATAAIGGFMNPLMEKNGYDKRFNAAVNITSSTVGLMIPPSNILIVYSLASGGVSIAALFMAGYIPGILIGLSIMFTAGIIAFRRSYPKGQSHTLAESMAIFGRAIPSLLLVIVVMGGILAGIFTATEASAVAVLYAFLLSVFIYREISYRRLPSIFLETAVTTSIVMFLIAASMAMSWVLSYENVPQNISSSLIKLSNNPYMILIIINIILLVVGTFMDMTPAVLIFTPIFLPVVTSLGVDPVHFGILMVANLSVGICTPPVGSVLFVGCSIAGISITSVLKNLIPFYVAMLFVLLLITFIPALSTFLPRLLGL